MGHRRGARCEPSHRSGDQAAEQDCGHYADQRDHDARNAGHAQPAQRIGNLGARISPRRRSASDRSRRAGGRPPHRSTAYIDAQHLRALAPGGIRELYMLSLAEIEENRVVHVRDRDDGVAGGDRIVLDEPRMRQQVVFAIEDEGGGAIAAADLCPRIAELAERYRGDDIAKPKAAIRPGRRR